MFAAVAAPVVGGAAFFFPKRANAYYRGPVSDHFDGERFFNPVGRTPKGLDQVMRLYWMETWEKWPAALPSPFTADRPPPRVSGAGARLSYVGHASWLLQTASLNILIDPHWSARASPVSFAGPTRANPPGIVFEDLPKIDVVIVTHNHYDHMDVPTVARLWTRDRPLVVTPLGNDTILKADIPDLNTRTVDWHDRVDLAPDLSLFAEPTQHWSARGTRAACMRCGQASSSPRRPAKYIPSATPASRTAAPSAMWQRAIPAFASHSFRSAPTSRAGSCPRST
jgi:hypothetical protein